MSRPKKDVSHTNANSRWREWLSRYAPAEISGTFGALTGAWIGFALSDSAAVAAVAGTWGENIGYYTVIILQDLFDPKIRGLRATIATVPRMVFTQSRNMLIEFGVAEALDSLLIRPSFMYFGARWFDSLWLGILVGKLAADILFYLPTIIGYELRKKLFAK